MICKKCNKYEITYRNECKVCGFKKRRKEDIDKVLNKGFWSFDELEIIVYSILYQKYDCINEIVPLLNNKTLEDLVKLLNNDLVIRGLATYKIKTKCDVCGKEYLVNLSVYNTPNHHYCSMECRNNGFNLFGSHKGEKNSRYNSKKIKCTNCNKEYLAPKYKQEQTNSYGENNHFCCQECYWEYRKKHYVKEKNFNYGLKFNEERCNSMREITLNRISKGGFPQTMTKPHIKINESLDKLCIKYTNEFKLKYQCLDIYLDNYNLGIEIMGDYWHGNPIKYTYDKLNDTQLKDVMQDKRKHTYTKKYHNFEILYLWENDIKNNVELCEKLINLYIQNNGILKNYNSFNYKIINNTIILKDEIINPYFIKQNP